MAKKSLITITIDDKKLQLTLGRLSKSVKNFTPLFRKISPKVLRRLDKQFTSTGKAFDTPWKTLKSKTVIQKLKLGLNKGILQRTRKLRRSWKVKRQNRQELVIGSTLQEDYMKYHQLGTRKIPKRPMFKISSRKFLKEINKIVQKYYKKVLNG